MKKFLSIALIGLTGVAFASANDFTGQKIERKAVPNVNESFAKAVRLHDRPVTPNLPTRADEDGWESLGYGWFRDCMFYSLFDFVEPQDMECEVQKSTIEEGFYRFINPYYTWENPFSDVVYDFTGTYPLNIHIQNVGGTDYFYMDDFTTGLTIQGQGRVVMISQLGPVAAQYGIETVMTAYENGFGKFADGVFTYPEFMTVTQPDHPAYGDDYYNLLMAINNAENILAPSNTALSPFTATLPGVDIPALPDPFDIYIPIGEGIFKNNMMTPLLREPEDEPYSVEIFHDTNSPFYYHIKGGWGKWNTDDPYADLKFFFQMYPSEAGGFYYIPCATMPMQYSGYNDYELGQINVMSLSYAFQVYATEESLEPYQFAEQYPNDCIYLDIAAKKVIFPANCVAYVGMDSQGDGDFLEVDPNYQFAGYLEFPAEYTFPDPGKIDFSAVQTIGQEDYDGPVRYFNLQGVELNNPAKGQIVIMKKGSKTSKFIAR